MSTIYAAVAGDDTDDPDHPRRYIVLFKTGQQAEIFVVSAVIAQIVADIRDERRVGLYAGWPALRPGGGYIVTPPREIVLSLPDVLAIT